METKIPTYENYYNHDGLHYKKLWKSTSEDWTCPACGRSKFQIMKWTRRFPNKPEKLMGWVAALHRHHDHSVGLLESGVRRFPETIICGQCNATDGVVKKKLKLPSKFSFSPLEMRSFIQATPHDSHKIDYDIALTIYKSLGLNDLV